MMKASPLTRPAPSPSPSFHHRQPPESPRTRPWTSPLKRARRDSQHRSPRDRPWVGVDAGTQWTPRGSPRLPATQQTKQAAQHRAASVPAATVETAPVQTHATVQAAPQQGTRPLDTTKGHPRETREPKTIEDLPTERTKAEAGSVKVLPARYELCAVEDMVVLIADMIAELLETNDQLPLRTGSLTRFHSRVPPDISVHDYLQRLAKHATLTPPILLSMVNYIDKLCSCYAAFTITSLTVHRFLITAATVAAKGLSDSFWNTEMYARIGGVKVQELGQLEIDFLQRVDWRIVPVPETLVNYYKGLVGRSSVFCLEVEEPVEDAPPNDTEDITPSDQSEITTTDTQWDAWMQDVSSQHAKHAQPNDGQHHDHAEALAADRDDAQPMR